MSIFVTEMSMIESQLDVQVCIPCTPQQRLYCFVSPACTFIGSALYYKERCDFSVALCQLSHQVNVVCCVDRAEIQIEI